MHSAFAAQKKKFKSSPANVDFKTSILKLQKSANISCTGRLEGMLMKLDPTQRYSIGVMVWTGAEGSQIKLSGTGRKVDQIFANLELGSICDLEHVKVECKTFSHQFSWLANNDYDLMCSPETQIVPNVEVADGDFPRMGYNFTLLSSLGSFALHSIFDCFGYVTDADDMLVPLAAGDTYWSNAKMNITIADENGIRLVIENMGNFRKHWPALSIRADTIIKVKGLELKASKSVEEGEDAVWIAHAFDDTIFRVDEQLPEAQAIFHLINDEDPPLPAGEQVDLESGTVVSVVVDSAKASVSENDAGDVSTSDVK